MKLILKIGIIIIIFFAGFWIGQKQALAPTDGQTDPVLENKQRIVANLVIDFGGGRILNSNPVSMPTGASVFDLLKIAAADKNLKLEYKDYGGDLGVFVESIDQVANDPASGIYWQYWVNNEFAKIGASSYKLKGGETVAWKYVKSQM
jgi:hypothetical protein